MSASYAGLKRSVSAVAAAARSSSPRAAVILPFATSAAILALRVGVDRRVARAGERRARDECSRLLHHGLVREPRRVHAFVGRKPRAFERLADRAADFADPCDVGRHVGFIVDAMEADELLRQTRVRPVHLMEDVAPAAERQRVLGSLQRVDPQVV